jgi:hypothetical protein
MKTLFTLLLSLITIQFVSAQEKAELTIAGISPETEKAIIPGDRVSYFAYEDGGSSRNIIVKVITDAGKRRFFGSVDAKPDATGHYNFSGKVEIKESSKLSFDKDMEILVSMPTIFGNEVWTKVNRSRANLSDPIILDKYSEKVDKEDWAPRKRLNPSFSAITYEEEIKKKVTDNGDDWTKRKREDFHFFIKNKGDQAWKIDYVADKGMLTNGTQLQAFIPYNDELDLDRMIVMRVELTTEKGNLLWNEVEIESRGLTQVVFGENYTIVSDETATPDIPDATSDNNTTDNGTSNTSTTNTSSGTSDRGTDQNSGSSINTTSTGQIGNGQTTTLSSDVTTATVANGAATDLTTKTVKATCATLAAGDSLVNMNGSIVCINGIKAKGTKSMTGKLALDVNIEIDGTVFPLKGGSVVTFSKSDGSLVEGILRADVTHKTSVGEVTFKEGKMAKFQSNKLIGGSLAGVQDITVNETSMSCVPNTATDFDLRFDVQGRLVEFTSGKAVDWTASDLNLKFPEMSRMVFKGGELYKVMCPTETSFSLNGRTINVSKSTKSSAYEFSKGSQLTEVTSGAGNTMEIQGQSIPVEDGSAIKFNNEGGKTIVERFNAGASVTLKVTKGKGEKETTVKSGKKIVLKNGVVVKAG